MREIVGALVYGGRGERTVSRQRLRRDAEADAGVRADRLRRREALLHMLELARRRRRSRHIATRFTWDPAASWDDLA